MPVQFLPTLVKVGTVLGPIILNEIRKPRFRKFLEGQVSELGQQAIKRGKARLSGPVRGRRTFIMRRGRQQFQCRKVN